MKRLVMAVAALAFSATMSFTSAQSKEPFNVDLNKLNSYLELTPSQKSEVENINEYFIEMQKSSFSSNPVRQEKKMQQAVYGNLKLMKETLTTEQYRKYVTLLNVTNNNNHILGNDVKAGASMAEKK